MKKYRLDIPGVGEEDILMMTRKHWASMLGNIVIVILMFVAPLFLYFLLSSLNIFSEIRSSFLDDIVLLIGSVYYLVAATFAFLQWINYYYDFSFLTEDEVIDISQEGFFNRHITQIGIFRVQDVSGQIKGFVATLFGFGDVIAESAGERTQTYIIEDIPNPMEVADLIIELHDGRISSDGGVVDIGDIGRLPGLKKVLMHRHKEKKDKLPPTEDSNCDGPIVPDYKNNEQTVSKNELEAGGEIRIDN